MDVMPKPIILSELQPPIKANPNVSPRVWSRPEFRDGTRPPPPPSPLILDSFDNGNRPTQPDNINPDHRYLWSDESISIRPNQVVTVQQYASLYGQNGISNITNTIESTAEGNRISQFQLRPVFLPVYGEPQDIKYMYEVLDDDRGYKFNHYNRLSFWTKTTNTTKMGLNATHKNFDFGTYNRSKTTSRSQFEDNNHHYYHYYNLPHYGVWHKIVVDWHPSHQRGLSGNQEHGEKEFVTGEAGINYFDSMTRFYLDMNSQEFLTESDLPKEIYYDHFLVYRDDKEIVDETYSMHGCYVANSNLIHVGWSRLKTGGQLEYLVRHAFESVHDIGWDNATPSPEGAIQHEGGAYNTMYYETDQINVGSNSRIFIAVKPALSDHFREFEVRLDIGA
jgi:hypothetical protein